MKASRQPDSTGTTHTKPACPVCKSQSVTTTAKHPDIDSYWRCEQCGEVWNIGRRHEGRVGGNRWR